MTAPTLITIGRFAKWSLTILKKTFLGIGGISLLVIVGLYVAGALVEPLRWYLVGTASALLLLCGGLLVLFYVRSSLKGMQASLDELKKALSALKATLVELRKEIKMIEKEMKTIERELSLAKDDVFIIGYDILKEQDKLAEKVSQLETKASNIRRAKRPPNDSIE